MMIRVRRNLSEEQKAQLEYEASQFVFSDNGCGNPCEAFETCPQEGLIPTIDQWQYNDARYRYLESRYFENAILNGEDYPEDIMALPYADKLLISSDCDEVDEEYERWVGRPIMASRDGIDEWTIFGIEEDGQLTYLDCVPECRFFDDCGMFKLNIVSVAAISYDIEEQFAKISKEMTHGWKLSQMSAEERKKAPKWMYEKWARDPWNYEPEEAVV